MISYFYCVAALPPDVRQGSALPAIGKQPWAQPLVRPLASEGTARTSGVAAIFRFRHWRGEASPHIGRQAASRSGRQAASRTGGKLQQGPGGKPQQGAGGKLHQGRVASCIKDRAASRSKERAASRSKDRAASCSKDRAASRIKERAAKPQQGPVVGQFQLSANLGALGVSAVLRFSI